jgi:hypothetical protein
MTKRETFTGNQNQVIQPTGDRFSVSRILLEDDNEIKCVAASRGRLHIRIFDATN